MSATTMSLVGSRGLLVSYGLALSVLCAAMHAHAAEPPDDASSLDEQVTSLARQGRHDQAIPLALRLLAVQEAALGRDHLHIATSLIVVGELHHMVGRSAIGLPHLMRALTIRESSLGPDHPDTGSVVSLIGQVHQSLGQFELALAHHARALAIGERAHGPDHPSTGIRLGHLANVHREMGQYARALPLYERSLAIGELSMGPEHPYTGTRLNNLAGLYREMGQYRRALPLYTRAVAIGEKTLGPRDPSTVTSIANLALLYRDMGRFEEALPLMLRALSIREDDLGPDHPSTGTTLNNLAGIYRAMGQHELALPLMKRALSISETANGSEHPATLTRRNNLGVLYRVIGEYEAALSLLDQVVVLTERVLGPEHPHLGDSLDNLALVHLTLGQYEVAESLANRALNISERAHGPHHPTTGNRLNNLALIYRAQGQFDRALPILIRAAAISESTRGPEHPETSSSLNNLALLHKDMGQFEIALPLAMRALAISEQSEGPEHPSTANGLNTVAGLYRDLGNDEQATTLYRRAFTIAERVRLPETAWNVSSSMMRFYSARGADPSRSRQNALAIWYGKQAVNTLQSVRNRMGGLDKDLQKGFLAKNESTYQTLANLLIEAGRLPEAEQVLAMLKERELGELVRANAQDAARLQADYVGLEKAFMAERERLTAGVARDAAELAALDRRHKNGDTLSPDEQARHQQLLTAAEAWRAEYERFLARLGERFAESARSLAVERADVQTTRLQDLVANDPAGALGLHFVVAEDRVGIIVATARDSFGRFSMVPRAELSRQVSAMREAIKAKADTRPAAQALWRMLIAPVQADIQAAAPKTLVLALTDILRYLPFGALQAPDGRYLVEDHALALLASAGNTTITPGAPAWRVAGLGLTQAREGYSALPAVRRELQAIVREDGGTSGVLPGRIKLDHEFTRTELDAALAGQANVLHLASHFDFKPGDEERSVLLLGNGQTLSLKQLNVMSFRGVEQLTLSACNTATGGGRNENGAEVEGLAATVLKRQARSVLATLWPVADDSTAQLMRDFYSARATPAPASRAQALRQAQLAMLRGGAVAALTKAGAERAAFATGADGKPVQATDQAPTDLSRPWAHPYYWAPFVLSGSWL